MPPKKTGQDTERMKQIIAEARREQEQREKGYRERALKIYPPVCARCGREFTGQRLRELTVHHRDHDHNNNPPDGSNWELLCLYCHDNEHQQLLNKNRRGGQTPGRNQEPRVTFRPFANLESLLEDEE
jgi:5-methylcytosine-specific restriction endonuclease McrA